ncbi:MAG: hypothetical protein HDR74_08685 [Bacteroides sp.]|nr:hypothetical protein [Bacteroidales bacterium]MBD5379943.1 hypothetical protein [Bacteroides sp.]MDE5809623.1 hypothetical protein [Muribaculaceae bacterium]
MENENSIPNLTPTPNENPKKTNLTLVLVIILAVIILAGGIAFFSQSKKMEKALAQNEQLQLANDQLTLSNEYQALNNEFAQYENQTRLLANDSLVEKYAAARSKVEKLLLELKNEKTKNAKRIKQLQDEVATLKGILRHYVEQIDSLAKENQGLRSENENIKDKNRQLSKRVDEVARDNAELTERMVLAEKLNVTGVMIQALKANGKNEKNITKARQLVVTFSIPQNNSTPVGEKDIYMRLISPEGDLLGNGGVFNFEGQQVKCTARKTIEYAGEEIGGIKIFWDVNATLNPGTYTVELFCDNYRIASRHFELRK